MVSISDSLAWSLISRNNSKMVKTGGSSKRTGLVIFSREAGNVANLHSFKNSGLANTETVDVATTGEGDAVKLSFVTSVPSKSSNPNKSTTSSALNKCYRTSVSKVIKKQAANRMDMQGALEAKYSTLKSRQMVAKGLRKASASSTGRK